ncbi:MAG: phosphoribosylformylglycinamidine synthase, partial [Clostridia bacterium]|nr:phosphoribosylformylglycinamidine synthase [Clostridia bacterium]
MSVFRIYVEKKPSLSGEADRLCNDLVQFSGVRNLKKVRIINRYDVEGLSKEAFDQCRMVVFAEPQLDVTYDHLPQEGDVRFAVEALPGQFDQRADSCAQCIQFVTAQDRPIVQYARVYLLYGNLTDKEIQAVKQSVINPVESREASLDRFDTLKMTYPIPETVETMTGFIDRTEEEAAALIGELGLAMDKADILFCQQYFRSEHRDPTITEIRMIDTYWSDHCRHTTFLTNLNRVEIEEEVVRKAFDRYLEMRRVTGREKRPVNLMDIATIGSRYLKKTGKLNNLDESEEINACSVVIDVNTDQGTEKWLCMFKNETHNHPTEIEPFGGAATCIGGAIRDPLSGRSYVYQAMRVTGAANPLSRETLPGKLPQRKLVTTAAAGYSSYGNQIGLATGLVHEFYHPGYVAKRLEIGAVVGAAPVSHVRREEPVCGDLVILLGGRTGRDGCGGATGSSKSHSAQSLEECGAEVQKGNAPEERKLQRLFRKGEVTRLIKRCNDFGAGGVSVAIGELADGLDIDLNAVPRKYDGLDGTELAISESQERMAVVIDPKDKDLFLQYAAEENIEATPVAVVTDENRLRMTWNGNRIVDISREFLNSNGAPKNADVHVDKGEVFSSPFHGEFKERMQTMVGDLNVASQKGLSERFDSTIGAGSVLMPFGGKYQLTPMQMMAAKIPVLHGDTTTVSCMAFGFQPYWMEKHPFVGAYYSVLDSVSKLIAGGAPRKKAYLTLQEYFQSMTQDPHGWGLPFGALLGALQAQDDLQVVFPSLASQSGNYLIRSNTSYSKYNLFYLQFNNVQCTILPYGFVHR